MKNNQIAALLQELRVMKGRVEARDHQLADLRDRAATEGREKGEVIAHLNDTVRILRNDLEVANTWLGRERTAREAAESSLERERSLLVDARDQLDVTKAELEASQRQFEASQKQVEGKLVCPCLVLTFGLQLFC